MHGGQPGQQLIEQGADEPRGQRSVVTYDVDEGTATHQFHGEQHLVVVGGPAGGGEHMRVIDPQGLFADEAQQGVRVALLQHLGCHIPTSTVVPRAPDGADAPAPYRVDQFVPPGEDLTHALCPLPVSAVSDASESQLWCAS